MSGVIPGSVKLLMAKGEATTVSGVASVFFKVPSDREIMGGFGCFGNQQPGDYVKIYVTDEDNTLGYGAGFVVGSFNDSEMPANQQGWFMFPGNVLDITSLMLNDPSKVTPPFYVKLEAHKADGSADTLYANIRWGKRLR